MGLCDECNGRCCTRFIYFLTHKDLERISQKLKADPLHFTTAWSGSIDSAYPTFLLNKKSHYLVLDHVPGTSRCVFAIKLNTVHRCGIHSTRPINCKIYPFTLNGNAELDSVETFLCPKQWFPEGEEKEQYRRDIIHFKQELEEYEHVVKEWNKEHSTKASFAAFLDFLQHRAKEANALKANVRESN